MIFDLFRKNEKFEEDFQLLSRDTSGVVIGSLDNEPIIDTSKEAVAVYAPARSGISAAILIPTLLTWKESVVVVDLHGQLFEITSDWRREVAKNKIFCFDLDKDFSLQKEYFDFLQSEYLFTVYLKISPCNLDKNQNVIKEFLNAVVRKQAAYIEIKKNLLLILDEFNPESPYFEYDDLSGFNANCVKPIFVTHVFDSSRASILWDICPVRVVMQQKSISHANLIADKIKKIAPDSKFIRFNKPPVLPQEILNACANDGCIIDDSLGNIIHGKILPYYNDKLFSKHAKS